MGNAAIAGTNLADLGRVNASSQVVTLPVANLLDPDIGVRWRSVTNSDFFVCDLGSSQSIGHVLALGLTLGPASTARLRISSADASGSTGDVLDTGIMVNGNAFFSTDYEKLAWVGAAALTGRYVRVDLYDPAATFVEVGRLVVGAYTTFTYNFAWGWSVGWVDRSTQQQTRGGQTLIWRDNNYRTLDLTLGFVTATQRYGIVETIDRVNGLKTDVLIITDSASVNFPRDCFWGLISELTAVVQPSPMFAPDGVLSSKNYKLKERL